MTLDDYLPTGAGAGLIMEALARQGVVTLPKPRWVCVEAVGVCLPGMVFEESQAQAGFGSDRGVGRSSSGTGVFVTCVASDPVLKDLKVNLDDGRSNFRVLPIEVDVANRHYGDPRTTLDLKKPLEVAEWPVLGPQTALRPARFMVMRVGTCIGYRDHWVAECHLV